MSDPNWTGTTIWAVLPVKRWGDAKGRLASEFAPEAREQFARAMLTDFVAALAAARSVAGLIVVSSEPGVAVVIGDRADEIVPESAPGHPAAAAEGVTRALARGADRVMLVAGDCPLVDAGEIEQAVERFVRERLAVGVVPDRHGTGTNALLLAPPTAIAPAFGPDSCRRHLGAAQAARLGAAVIEVPSLACDVDTPEDLMTVVDVLAAREGGAEATRQALAELAVNRRQLPGGIAR